MIVRGLGRHAPTPESNEFLADVLASLGLVYTHQRKFEPALASFDRAFSIMKGLGIFTSHASMSITYNKAVVFRMTNRVDEAETYLRDAAAYFSRNATNEHTLTGIERKPWYLRILNDLGEVMLREGSVPETFQLFQRVHQGLGDSSRPSDPQPAQPSLKLNMGRALTNLGDFSKARELLEEVVSVYTEWWGRRHPEAMRTIDELAWTLMESCKDRQTKHGDIDVAGAQRAAR